MPTASIIPDDIKIADNIGVNKPDLLLKPEKNILTGKKELSKVFQKLTSLEVDLLTLAASVFGSDLAFKRGEREEITRKITLNIPVVNLGVFEQVKDDITYALYLLSHDAWKINFLPRPGIPEPYSEWQQGIYSKVLLFSGGIDSFAAALLLGEEGKKIQLISHVTANRTISATQDALCEYLQSNFPEQFTRIPFHVSGRDRSKDGFSFPSDQDREETQRTRSFMFLSLAALVARRRGISEVVFIAENGQMAIHLPLSAGRISAFSTHTAHPEFILVMEDLLNKLLSYKIEIENPFLYKTKAEVVKSVAKKHSHLFVRTVSCWRASRIPGEFNHCGICVPCLVRRIALEQNGIVLPEYQRDLLSEDVSGLDPNDDGKRNLVDLGEFVKIFESRHSPAELLRNFPELGNHSFDTEKAIEMYRRFSVEARTVFNRYPLIKNFLV